MTVELAVLELLAGGWVKDIEGPLGEESGGLSAAGSGHGGDGVGRRCVSGHGGLRVHLLGMGAPLGWVMDPPLEVAPPLLGLDAPLGLGMDPPLDVAPPLEVVPPLEVAPPLVVAPLLGWLMEAQARFWFSSGQKGRGAWILWAVTCGGFLWRRP